MSLRRQRWLWITLAAALNLVPWFKQPGAKPSAEAREFRVSPADKQETDSSPPKFREEFIDDRFRTPSAHVASLCELPGGRLAATWYGGTREGARDVSVYWATREPGDNRSWSMPRAVVTRAGAAQETFRYVKKIGNAVVFGAGSAHVFLLYVSVGIGGWSDSSLNLKESFDGGQSWTGSQRLGLSPFFNVSELVKNGPTPLANGGWAVPVYHELAGKFPELLWLYPSNNSLPVVKSRAFGGHTAFQPALVAFDAHRAALLCRTAGRTRTLYLSRTADSGEHWTEPVPTGLPNSDSGLDAIRLKDGRILLAFNDSPADRHVLRLAVSQDEAASWRLAAVLAEESGAEFSYPFLLQSSDGLIHVVYTWKRRGIKHVVFNSAWLSASRRSPPP